MTRRRKWGELSAASRRNIALSGTIQVVLLAAALSDIYRRPESEVRGSKWAWAAISLVNFVGPISYFAFGRKR